MDIDEDNNSTASFAVLVLSHSTLADILYPHLSVHDILNLELVCRATRAAVKAWLPSGYNIDRHLSHYFDDPIAFRRLQAVTGSLISGSNALEFFERTSYSKSDLDLYVPCRHTLEVAKWLEQHDYVYIPYPRDMQAMKALNPRFNFQEGFRGVDGGVRITSGPVETYLQSMAWRNYTRNTGDPVNHDQVLIEIYGFRGLETVLKFRSVPGERPSKGVDVIIAQPEASPLACILSFHSTLVMNFIAYDAAYSLFPNATFLNRTCLTFGERSGPLLRESIYFKYWKRGFKISAVPLPVVPLSPPHPSSPYNFVDKETKIHFGDRFISDKNVWRIPLNTDGILGNSEQAKAALYSECLRSNGFSLYNGMLHPDDSRDLFRNPGHDFYDLDANFPIIYFNILGSVALETRFILPNMDFKELWGFVKAQEKMTWTFLMMLKAQRQRGNNDGEDMNVDQKYWDAEALRFLKQVVANHEKGRE